MNMNKLMQQAQNMQEQMKKLQEKQEKIEVLGESGAGLVKIKMTGKHDVRNIEIDQSLLKENKELIEDLLIAAINDAVRRVEESNKSIMSGMTQGLNLPSGFKFPL